LWAFLLVRSIDSRLACATGTCAPTALVTESLERLERATDLNVVSEIAVDEALREAKRIDEGERAPGPC